MHSSSLPKKWNDTYKISYNIVLSQNDELHDIKGSKLTSPLALLVMCRLIGRRSLAVIKPFHPLPKINFANSLPKLVEQSVLNQTGLLFFALMLALLIILKCYT
jgi:uncharacterized membrane protein YcaP (DUF421 family)